jgi:hypothetical protein
MGTERFERLPAGRRRFLGQLQPNPNDESYEINYGGLPKCKLA